MEDAAVVSVEKSWHHAAMSQPAPHRYLYTRLGMTSHTGIGVFAIRDIPAGVNPFEGDDGAMVRVPVAEVERIAEPALREVYVDFCPVEDGAYLAPVNLNLLTTGWYMNHSEKPNVASRLGIEFVAMRLILEGEELTTDYSHFSDDAKLRLAQRRAAAVL